MKKLNPSKTARNAGLLYLALIPLGVFGIMYVPSNLIVIGDAYSTAINLMENEFLYRLSIVSALLVQVVQIFLVLTLYKLLKPVNENHAVLVLVLILAAVPIAMLNELNQMAPLLLLNESSYLNVFTTQQLQALVSMFLNLHEYGVIIAQVFWGLWLFPMGYLIYKSGFLPKIIGVLLMIACFGYLIDSFMFIAYPDFNMTFSEFTFIGEVVFPLWLVFKGVDIEKWEKVVA